MAKQAGVMKINGLPVVDAKQLFKMKVTARDIKAAHPKDPRKCAGALAIERQWENCEFAEVHTERVYVKPKGAKYVLRFRTPSRLRRELIVLDRGGQMQEFECSLGALTPSRQTGRRQGGRDRPLAPGRRINKKLATPKFITGIRDRGANR